MLKDLPQYIVIVFIFTTLITLILFARAISKSSLKNKTGIVLIGMLLWLTIQLILSLNLVYVNTVDQMPPLFPIIGFMPPFVLMIILFNTKSGKRFIDSLPLKSLVLISVVRIPVEFVLFWLAIEETLPFLLTFEGRNFDIIAGITAPLMIFFGFSHGLLKRKILLGWNVISTLLLLNIVVMALLSFPTEFQQISFDRANEGILYFPFFWLPSFIVPVVFFSHFVSIRRLISREPSSARINH